MKDQQTINAYLRKTQESLASRRGGPCVLPHFGPTQGRSLQYCFQAAIAALLTADIGPRDPRGRWNHGYVQAAFSGQLINRRKLFSGRYGDWLNRQRDLRETADYESKTISQKEADRALRRSRDSSAPFSDKES